MQVARLPLQQVTVLHENPATMLADTNQEVSCLYFSYAEGIKLVNTYVLLVMCIYK